MRRQRYRVQGAGFRVQGIGYRYRGFAALTFVSIVLLAGGGQCAFGQARSEVTVQIPAAAGFNVTDVTRVSRAAPFTVRFTDIRLRGQAKTLRVGVRAMAATFTPPTGQAMPASLVFWTTGGVQNGVGSGGTLNNTAFTTVFTSIHNPRTASFEVLWNLAAPGPGIRAGAHTLTVNWRIEAL